MIKNGISYNLRNEWPYELSFLRNFQVLCELKHTRKTEGQIWGISLPKKTVVGNNPHLWANRLISGWLPSNQHEGKSLSWNAWNFVGPAWTWKVSSVEQTLIVNRKRCLFWGQAQNIILKILWHSVLTQMLWANLILIISLLLCCLSWRHMPKLYTHWLTL